MAGVDIRAVHKHFGSTHVIRGVDIAIADGEFCVLVGPSGCGKSTLLRMIAGLEEIGAGEIAIGGTVVNRVPPKERDIAMVFQNYALYPHMTVRDNMSFALMLAKRTKDDIGARVQKAADILGLAPYLDRYPRQLSGGQRQRVAMGRAIVRDPQVFLFDEPLSNLDAKLRVQMRTEIKELHQRLETTSIYVTHDQIEAMTMADKIVVMRDGIVEQTGGPLDLYDHPVNTFVAGFIGSPAMNMIPGTARTGGRRALRRVRRRRRAAVAARARAPRTASPCCSACAPSIARSASSGLPVQVVVVEPTGADTQLYCRFNGQEVTATIGDRADCHPGDRINLAPDLSARASVRRCDRFAARRHESSDGIGTYRSPQPEEDRMSDIKRRDFLKATAGVAAGTAIGSGSALFAPQAEAQFKLTPEKGAKLRVLRWKRFVQGDEDVWAENTKKFTQTTGIEVRVDAEGWEDVRPKAAVAANVGSGPDIIISTMEDAHMYPEKLVDVSDVANYLGNKYGGWYDAAKAYGMHDKKWVAIMMGAAGQRDRLPRQPGQGGGLRHGAEGPRPASSSCARRSRPRARRRASRSATRPATRAGRTGSCWAHGGKLVDAKNNVVINSPETIAALEYSKQLYETFIPGTLSWLDPEQQQGVPRRAAFAHRERHLGVLRGEDVAGPEAAGDGEGHPARLLPARGRRQGARAEPRVPDDDLQVHEVPERGQGCTCSS